MKIIAQVQQSENVNSGKDVAEVLIQLLSESRETEERKDGVHDARNQIQPGEKIP